MQIKLVYSQHKQALWDHCLSRISEHTGLWPDHRAFLIVPESIKADTERRYLEKYGHSGLMMAEVLSFRRLAYRLFAEAGGLAVDYVSPAGKSMLIQSLIRQHRDELRRFSRFADRPGYAAEVESVLGDFHRYEIRAEDLRQISDQSDDPALRDKLYDFSFIYEKYMDSLEQRGLTDHDQDLDRLQELLAGDENRLRFLRQTSVWIYGFGETRDLTAQEYKIIDGLLRWIPKLTITVCTDIVPGGRQLAESGPVYLRQGRLSAYRLISKYQVDVEKAEAAWPGYASVLADWLLNDNTPDPLIGLKRLKDSVNLVRASDKRQELAFTAGEIRRLISEGNYRYRDIAVAVCDLSSSQFLLRSVFREYGLDSFVDVQRTLAGTSLTRYVQNLLMLCQSGERFDNLVGLLRTGLATASMEAIDEYENYCLACGLQRFNRFRRTDSYPQEREGTIRALEFKAVHVDPLLGFCREFNQSGSIPGRCRLLFDFLCGSEHMPERLENRIAELKLLKEDHAALTLAQAWNTLNRLFEDMTLMFDSKPVSGTAFYSIISAGMAGSVSQAIPFGLDRILIGDARQMYQHPCKILFIIGSTQANFPAMSASEGLLRNSEREQVANLSGKVFPNLGSHRLAEESFRVFTLLTLAEDKLYLCSPSLQDNPSVYQQRLYELLENETILKNDGSIDVRVNSINKAHRVCRLLQLSSAEEFSDQEKILQARALQLAAGRLSEYFTDKIPLEHEPLEPDATAKIRLAEEALLARIPEHSTISVSRVQLFNACPYSHYASYLLGLKEREENKPDPMNSGTILHALAEAAFSDLTSRLAAAGFNVRELPPGSAQVAEIFNNWQQSMNQNYIDQIFRSAVLSARLPLFTDPVIYAGAGRILRKMAAVSLRQASSQVSPAEFMPLEQEWFFPANGWSPLTLTVKQRKLEFKGVIDRIDLHADQKHCRIIDYKSSKHEIDYDEIFHGLQLQLPVYLHAWLKTNPQLEAAAIGYFRFDNPRQSYSDSLAAPDGDLIRSELQKKEWLTMSEQAGDKFQMLGRFAFVKVKESLRQMFEGKAGAVPACIKDKNLPCEYCRLQAMCQYDNRTIRQKARIIKPVSLPADYPDIEKMNQTQKRAERQIYLESLMNEALQLDEDKSKSEEQLNGDEIQGADVI